MKENYNNCKESDLAVVIKEGIEKSMKKLIEEKKKKNQKMVIMEGDEIKEIDPQEL